MEHQDFKAATIQSKAYPPANLHQQLFRGRKTIRDHVCDSDNTTSRAPRNKKTKPCPRHSFLLLYPNYSSPSFTSSSNSMLSSTSSSPNSMTSSVPSSLLLLEFSAVSAVRVASRQRPKISDQHPGETSPRGTLAKTENTYPPGFFNFPRGGCLQPKRFTPPRGENSVTYGNPSTPKSNNYQESIIEGVPHILFERQKLFGQTRLD